MAAVSGYQGRHAKEMPLATLASDGDVEGGVDGGEGGTPDSPPSSAPPAASEPAPMRNMYTAAMSYNGYTITDGALRVIVLLHAADLGFSAIEIAFMFSMYEVR